MNPEGYHGLDGTLGTLRIPVKFTVTTAGAVDEVLRGGEYIASIVKGTTGFVVTFLEPCVDFIGHNLEIVPAAYDETEACYVKVADVDVTNQTAPTITFLTVDGDGGIAVDMTTGDTIYGEIVVKFTSDEG